MKLGIAPFAKSLIVVFVPLISIFTWFSGTDPVNLPKAVLLSCLSSALIGLLLWSRPSVPKKIVFGILFFWLSLVPPLALSGAPLEQQLFGVYGRNTGFITYLSLSVLCLAVIRFADKDLAKKLVIGLMVSGVINLVLSIFQINDIELLGYNNTYNNVLGTFGNPNFVSAFLAMSSAVPFNFVLAKSVSRLTRLTSATYLALAFFVIIKSDALQGLFVFLGLFFMIILIHLHYSDRRILKFTWITGGAFAGLSSTLGIIGIGPLSQLLNQRSVKLRGEYWQAGINMSEKNLFSGVGLNSYGDWYREARDPSALILPGVNTVTNSSHNVFIDYLATGGILHLLAYLLILSFVISSIYKQFKKNMIFDPIFSSLFLACTGYVVQSVVSIDQIGLSIWGWAIGAVLIAYPKFIDDAKKISGKSARQKPKLSNEISTVPIIVSTLLFFLGGSAYFKSVQSDLIWSKNFSTKSVDTLMEIASARPLVEGRLVIGSEILRKNGFQKEALELAQIAVDYNSRSYYGWLEILRNESASKELIATTKENLMRLDPNNNEIR